MFITIPTAAEATFGTLGDGYQIHKLQIALDQPGRGQGDLISWRPAGQQSNPNRRVAESGLGADLFVEQYLQARW